MNEGFNGKRPRLTIVTENLRGGGVARFVTTFSNYWVARGWTITLLLYDDGMVPPFYDLDARVACVCLGMMGYSPNPLVRLWHNLKRIRALRCAIRQSQPDCILSTMVSPNVLTLIAIQGLHLPIIVSERTDPFRYPLNKVWTLLRLWYYRKADRVTVQSESYKHYFPPTIQYICCAIPNPVPMPQNVQNVMKPEQEPPTLGGAHTVVAIGRIGHEKGFDLLLQAFARIRATHPAWSLVLWGDGPEQANLEALTKKLGLDGCVHLPGRTKQVFEKLRLSDLFVLSSIFEGFPNALVEAMACGLPVIAFDCSAGVRDIIRDGVDGVLVPPEDVDALAVAMDRLMRDEGERRRLAARAPEVLERFGVERVMGMWEQVITEVLDKHR